ncbi:MAG: DNA repair protein RecO [Oscillospiraceae bacterium]|nr:DNA repair protein RecO [Oscillospiraceae bacterium]
MHLTTKALVLRETAYKESDKILTLLSQTEGRLTVSARGCRKKGSAVAAACQMLVWAEFTLYEFQGRWAVKEAVIERSFPGVTSDLDKLALASYLAEVTEALSEEGQPEPELLSLTLNSLHALDKLSLPPALVKTAFEWKAMAIAGYEPMLDGCAVCGAEAPEQPRLNLTAGVLHCAACRGEVGEGISMPLTSAALAGVRHFVWGDPKRLFSVTWDSESLRRSGEASEAYLMTRLERGFRTLDFYKSVTLEK